jgi:hypothetical protein
VFSPIPLAEFTYGPPSPNPAPVQGGIVSAIWPLTVLNPPQPAERFYLSSFYLPVCALISQGATPPGTCSVTLRLLQSGAICFQEDLSVTMVAAGGFTGGWYIGTGAANVSNPTPIPHDSGQILQLGFQAQVDQGVVSLALAMAGVFTAPSQINAIPGSIGYDIAAVPSVPPISVSLTG